MIYLDTHVVFWLYAEGDSARMSENARDAVRDADELRISPMVRLELQYLREVERIGVSAAPIVDELAAVIGLRVCDAPFAGVVRNAEGQRWTRDPFDRLIVAQASMRRAPLLTRDETIRAHYSAAVW